MKKFTALLLALVMMMSLMACGGDKPAESKAPAESKEVTQSQAPAESKEPEDNKPEPITLRIGYMPNYASLWGVLSAMEQGCFEEEGITIELTEFGDGPSEISAMEGGSIDLAYIGKGAHRLCILGNAVIFAPSSVHTVDKVVCMPDSGIKTVEDLKGKRVGVGAANSGVELNARMIFEAYGMSYDDCTVDYLAYGEAIDNMKNGQCDAVFVTSGLPNATVTELATSYDMVIVPIEGAGRDALISRYPFYAATTIPADTYNNKEDVESVFVYNIMLVRADLSDAMVYDMLTGIFENISTIQASHNAADKNIYLDVGVSDIQLPLHPGAEKWWSDHGFTK